MEDSETSIPLQYFTGVNNVGDRLNPYLIRELFGLPVHLEVRPDRRRLIAIGSLIEAANELSDVWGTGAIGATSTIPSLRSEVIRLCAASVRTSGCARMDLCWLICLSATRRSWFRCSGTISTIASNTGLALPLITSIGFIPGYKNSSPIPASLI